MLNASEELCAAAVRPLPQRPPAPVDWKAMDLPTSGFVMLFDEAICPDCHEYRASECMEACSLAHGLPDFGAGKAPGACLHCTEPACATACPVEAISVHPLGAVLLDQTLCIGCRFCEEACSEGALSILEMEGLPQLEFRPYSPTRPDGSLIRTVAKCTFCVDRLLAGELPVCVAACPYHSMWVGNLDRNTATNGVSVRRLTDLLASRSYSVREPSGVQTRVAFLE